MPDPRTVALNTVPTVPTVPGAPNWMPSKFLYLLHFDAPHFHAQHYLGSSEDVIQRITAHANGCGACITRALYESDEEWTLAALYIPRITTDSIRDLERKAKRRHNAKAYCPLCNINSTSPRGTVSYPTPELSSRDLRRNIR